MFQTRKNAIFRFNLLVVLFFAIWGVAIIGIATKIMFFDRDMWKEVEEDYKKERKISYEVEIPARRGNILDDKGDLMVSTLPQYRIFFDFKYINRDNPEDAKKTQDERNRLWEEHMDEICDKLHEILPHTEPETFKKTITNGLKNLKGGVRLCKGRISYTQYKRIMELPIFNLGWKYSGVRTEEEIERRRIYDDIGCSTLGVLRKSEQLDGTVIEEIQGLEKTYDKYLRGVPGKGHIEKVGGDFITKTDVLPQNGYDIQTTLNPEMMDICYEEVKKVLEEKTLAAGWAVLLEAKTGDIKAIVNLTRSLVGGKYTYIETDKIIEYNSTANHSLTERNEPGSIFKTVAMTAMIEDKRITLSDSVTAYRRKVKYFDKHKVSDEMYRGMGETNLYSPREAMMYSSNIALTQFIRRSYLNEPETYTNLLKSFGITENYKVIADEVSPYMTTPDNKGWGRSTLHTLSYGYGIATTALNMVTFYNIIANDGKYIKPRLVKAIIENGKVIESFPTIVLDDQLVSKETADDVTYLLTEVVQGTNKIPGDSRYGKLDGTGKRANSKMMTIAGKTGTANRSNLNDNEKLMSFCGFFPAEDPEYTLIVQMYYDIKLDKRTAKERKDNSYGGGSTSAIAFKNIAERIMSKSLTSDIQDAVDGTNLHRPEIMPGSIYEANLVLDELGIEGAQAPEAVSDTLWGNIKHDKYGDVYHEAKIFEYGTVPDVRGMGAKDAIFLLQKCGMKVEIEGYGKVMSQSIEAGEEIFGEETIRLHLEP